MKIDRMGIAGETARTRARADTVGDLVEFLKGLDASTRLSSALRDSENREIPGCGVNVEVATYGEGLHTAWVTVDAPCPVPTMPRGLEPEDTLERGWRDREYAGQCPLMAVTALLSRKTCAWGGCASYGIRECIAHERALFMRECGEDEDIPF